MKLHYTKYKENYKKFILSTIDSDTNEKPIKKDTDKINYIFKRFLHIFLAKTNWTIKSLNYNILLQVFLIKQLLN